MATERFFYKVLVEALPGAGKTYSTRNLPRDTTGFINVEAKPLPFRGTFKHMVIPEKFQDILEKIAEFSRSPEITTVVLDSFSATMELAFKELRQQGLKGYDIWSAYNDRVSTLLDYIKRCKKDLAVIGHYEILNVEDSAERRLKVLGKAWEGWVEKEFTVVLFGEHLRPDDKGGKGEFTFWVSKPGTPAKCPPEVLGDDVLRMPNDLALFYNHLYKFLGIPPLVPSLNNVQTTIKEKAA